MKTFEEIIADALRAFDVEYAARYAGGIAGMHYAMARRLALTDGVGLC